MLHGDAHSESVLTDLGARASARARDLNVESNFEYGSRVGFWRIMQHAPRAAALRHRIRGGHGARAQSRAPPPPSRAAASRSPVTDSAGSTIRASPEQVERADILRNIEIITRLTGQRPVGWYTGRPVPNTRRLVVETGQFLYDSDAYNDDLPYWTQVAGRRHLVIPYSFDNNDSRLQRGGDFGTGEQFFTYCRDAFDWLYREGVAGRPRMMSIGLHCRIIGRPGRIGALAKLIAHLQHHEGVWLCTRSDIARHWMAHHAQM